MSFVTVTDTAISRPTVGNALSARVSKLSVWLNRDPLDEDGGINISALGNKGTGHLLILKHDTAEMWYRANVDSSYSPGHVRVNRRWNWQRAIEGK